MNYDYDHQLVIKICKVKVTDWLPNATGLKNHHSLIRNKVHCKVYSRVLNTNTIPICLCNYRIILRQWLFHGTEGLTVLLLYLITYFIC